MVKLADFGVAAKLTGASEGDESLRQSVVGTPYWMAPEVIEMTSVTAAADIWSVGCLCIELLTGQPPYFDLQPMSALFRIVQVQLSQPLPDLLGSSVALQLLTTIQMRSCQQPWAANLGSQRSTVLDAPWACSNRRDQS